MSGLRTFQSPTTDVERTQSPPADTVDSAIARHVSNLDTSKLTREFARDGEFLFLESFLPPALLERWSAELHAVLPRIHRNYVPLQKKGGSVAFDELQRLAPTIRDVYQSAAFMRFLSVITGHVLMPSPPRDLHACALYAYTEPGDHIGFHYDTSFYRGARFTVLLGVRDRSSSRLECRLHTREKDKAVEERAIATTPGSLVLFNGDTVLHRVTPLGASEERFIVTMQYVTDPRMGRLKQIVSDVKDAVAYFGFSKVFRRPLRRE